MRSQASWRMKARMREKMPPAAPARVVHTAARAATVAPAAVSMARMEPGLNPYLRDAGAQTGTVNLVNGQV